MSSSSGILFSPFKLGPITLRNRTIRAAAFEGMCPAVNLAREAGFDALEVHEGHGYLISQFISPYTNHRRDSFDGSI